MARVSNGISGRAAAAYAIGSGPELPERLAAETGAKAPPLTKIADLDRRWFHRHPGRLYRARYAAAAERRAFDRSSELSILVWHWAAASLFNSQ